MVLESSDEIKTILYQCGMTKAKLEEHRLMVAKRHQEDLMMTRNIRRRLGFFILFLIFLIFYEC